MENEYRMTVKPHDGCVAPVNVFQVGNPEEGVRKYSCSVVDTLLDNSPEMFRRTQGLAKEVVKSDNMTGKSFEIVVRQTDIDKDVSSEEPLKTPTNHTESRNILIGKYSQVD
ncbi:MAG: hypothetical protein ABIB79_01045 [archaeon]